jgi:hypothetical protein
MSALNLNSSEQWAFRDARGPKAAVIAIVEASAAPATVKAYLLAQIQALPCEGVILDAHAHSDGTNFVQHLHLAKLY